MSRILEAAANFMPRLYAIPGYPKGEYTPPPFRAVDLLTIQPDDLKDLKRQIWRNDRRLTVLAEPWFEQVTPGSQFPTTCEYEVARNEFLVGAMQSGAPVAIVEPYDRIEGVSGRIADTEGLVYTITTKSSGDQTLLEPYTGAPRAIYNAAVMGLREKKIANIRTAGLLKRGLRAAGVRDISVGGRLLVLHPYKGQTTAVDFEAIDLEIERTQQQWQELGFWPAGNVGAMARQLSRLGFNVTINSRLSSPAAFVNVPHG